MAALAPVGCDLAFRINILIAPAPIYSFFNRGGRAAPVSAGSGRCASRHLHLAAASSLLPTCASPTPAPACHPGRLRQRPRFPLRARSDRLANVRLRLGRISSFTAITYGSSPMPGPVPAAALRAVRLRPRHSAPIGCVPPRPHPASITSPLVRSTSTTSAASSSTASASGTRMRRLRSRPTTAHSAPPSTAIAGSARNPAAASSVGMASPSSLRGRSPTSSSRRWPPRLRPRYDQVRLPRPPWPSPASRDGYALVQLRLRVASTGPASAKIDLTMAGSRPPRPPSVACARAAAPTCTSSRGPTRTGRYYANRCTPARCGPLGSKAPSRASPRHAVLRRMEGRWPKEKKNHGV
nr:uncharacterized protein LOC127339255 [Lolium perenne]